MSDKFTEVGAPNIEISCSSPVDIVTTLISSITSVRNVDSINRTKYEQIQANLKAFEEHLKTHEKGFSKAISHQKEILENLYKFLDIASDGAKNGSGENAKYCRDLAISILKTITEINKTTPPIAGVSWNL